jgi:copper chaperone CopZ
MKRSMVAMVIAGMVALGAQAQTIKMEVNGLVCAFCAQGIEKKLRAMAPTKDVYVSLEKRLVAVALKDGQDIPDAALRDSLKDSGYDVVKVARTEESLDAVRKAAKAK